MTTDGKPRSDELQAEVIHLEGGMIQNVEADTVRIQQGGANQVIAKNVELYKGGALTIQGDVVGMQQGAAFIARGAKITSDESTTGAVLAEHAVLQISRIGITITKKAELNNSSSIVLLAREVEGNVETILDTRGALLAGLIGGIAVGLVLLVGNLLRRD